MYQKLISICTALRARYPGEDELCAQCGKHVATLASWEAICKYYKAESECYYSLLKWWRWSGVRHRLTSALRVIDCALSLLQEKSKLGPCLVLSTDDALKHFWIDCAVLKAEVLLPTSPHN